MDFKNHFMVYIENLTRKEEHMKYEKPKISIYDEISLKKIAALANSFLDDNNNQSGGNDDDDACFDGQLRPGKG